MLKRIFLHREKDQTKNFPPFYIKDLLTTGKNSWKSSQFHFKGFHFKSTSKDSFNKVWWKSRNHTEIRNPSETYLESSQRSMAELFALTVNSFFHSPGFSESKFFRVEVFQGPGFSWSRFFCAQVFQGPGPGSGSSF